MPNYRQLHLESLKQNRPERYQELRQSGELEAYLSQVHESAQSQHQRVLQQLRENHPYNPVEWRGSPEAWEGWLERTASELVLNDRVYVLDEETERAMPDGYVE